MLEISKDESALLVLDQTALTSATIGSADRSTTHNVEALERIYSTDFVLHSPTNTIMLREQVLEAAKRGARRESFWYESYVRTTEFARVLGEIGVTMGTETVVRVLVRTWRLARTFTHLYRRENDDWKLLVRHASTVVR